MKKISLILILLLTVTAFQCPKKQSTSAAIFTGQTSQKYQAKTPQQVRLYSPLPIPVYAAAAVDAGLQQAFDDATAREQIPTDAFRKHDVYTVWLYPRDSRCTAEGFITDIYAPGWDGHELDKDPRPGHTLLCIAGTLWLYQGNPGMVIVSSPGAIQNAAQFEAEHSVLMDALQSGNPCFHKTAYEHYHPIFGSSQCGTAFGVERTARHMEIFDGLEAVFQQQLKGDLKLISVHLVK